MSSGSTRRVRGFTLIELIVTIAVLAVLLAAAAPSFSEFFERYRLRSAADDTLSLFSMARQGAVKADRNVRVRFAADPANWCVGAVQQGEPAQFARVLTTPAPCDCLAANACLVGGTELVANANGRPGVVLAAGGADFTFDSKNGRVDPAQSGQNVTFISSTDRYRIRITVSPLGQVRACTPADKRPIPGYATCA